MITEHDNKLAPLSQPKQIAIQNWKEQPMQYYLALRTTTPRLMIEADTPTLWELRSNIGHAATIAILVKAILHAAKLVSIDKNITTDQIGEAANDILEEHGQLKVEELKFLLKRAMRTQNIYGRFDYNVLMNWVEDYVSERTEEAIRISDQEARQAENELNPTSGTVSYSEFMDDLRERAKYDKEAAEMLRQFEQPLKQRLTITSRESVALESNGIRPTSADYLLNDNRKENDE